MKTIIILITALLIACATNAQNLLDIYKKGTVKLVPDPEFAKDNNWDKVFSTYNHFIGKEQVGKRKSIRILPDGSFLVIHSYQKFFTKFNVDGSFEKEFRIKNSSGKVVKIPGVLGVLDNEILFSGVTNYGKMFCADLDGNLIKTLEVKYMASTIIPLPNKKFAIVGWVIWKDKFRDLVAIKDYKTGEETIIWDYFTPRTHDLKEIEIPNAKGKRKSFYISTGNRKIGLRPRPNIVLTGKNEILVCLPPTGELMFFDLNGKKLRTSNVDWKNDQVPVEELLKKHDEARERMANPNREISVQMVEIYGEEGAKMYREELLKQHDAQKKDIKKPMNLPYYSTIMEDSDNNLLFFEYAKEKGANQFNVYALNGEGEFVCKSSFVCDNYDLIINPHRLVFKDGFLYGVQELKDKSGIPMRLVKFKLEAAD